MHKKRKTTSHGYGFASTPFMLAYNAVANQGLSESFCKAEELNYRGVIIMGKASLFRSAVLWLIITFTVVLMFYWLYVWWLWSNWEADPEYLVAVEDIDVQAGDRSIRLPRGLVFYPVDERETRDRHYPGGHYKIYFSVENDISNLHSGWYPGESTNVIHKLMR